MSDGNDTDAHTPVMVAEVTEKLLQETGGIYLDATFGRGGHSQALLTSLDSTARIVGIDRDPVAVHAGQLLADADSRFTMISGRFSEMTRLAADKGVKAFDGILMDIGVSSPQLGDPTRGFSFGLDGPLDMRMDPRSGVDAQEWLNTASQEEIGSVLRDYGEERFAQRIAKAVVAERPLHTTTELAQLIGSAIPARVRYKLAKHPATRSFQAIRIFVNNELEELKLGMSAAWELLNTGGRLAVITFHSLEDRLVKRQFKSLTSLPDLPRRLPIRNRELSAPARLIGRPLKASRREVVANPRARSATLRVIEKITSDRVKS